MLPTINEISSQQAHPAEETNAKTKMLMDYAHTYPDAKIRYHASNMQLYIDSDAAYLVLPKARSRGARHFYFSNKLQNTTQIPTPTPNGPILTECVILKNVISSVAEELYCSKSTNYSRSITSSLIFTLLSFKIATLDEITCNIFTINTNAVIKYQYYNLQIPDYCL